MEPLSNEYYKTIDHHLSRIKELTEVLERRSMQNQPEIYVQSIQDLNIESMKLLSFCEEQVKD